MENVTQAVQDELVKSLDYKLGSSNVNYIQSRRDVQYFPSSLSTFTPTTSRVARIPLTSGMDFIDPESLKIAFRVRNNDATLDLNPGTQEPSCFIKRVQLFANGQRCDDISEYGRCCFLYSLLKPAEWYKNKGITGFWELAGLVPAQPRHSIHAPGNQHPAHRGHRHERRSHCGAAGPSGRPARSSGPHPLRFGQRPRRSRGPHRGQRFRPHRCQHQPDPGPGLKGQPVRPGRPAGPGRRQKHAGLGGPQAGEPPDDSSDELQHALKSVVDQLAIDVAARQTAADVDQRVATALLSHLTQTAYQAGQALQDARLDGHDAEILALQNAGPFATAGDLNTLQLTLQSAIDGILAEIATLGGATNLVNARLGRQRDLGPAGRHEPNPQPPRHGPPEHRPGQRRLDAELRLRCVHDPGDRRRHRRGPHQTPREPK